MQIQASIDINSSVEKVFQAFTNFDTFKNAVTGITNIDILSGDNNFSTNTKWKETRVLFGQSASEVMWVTNLENNKSYTIDAESHGMKYSSVYTFTPSPNGTLVEMTFKGVPVSFSAKLMTPIGLLFQGATKKALEKDMVELKQYIESH